MKLSKLLDIKVNSVISIVGAGGKSTLMYTLAQELRQDYKCLITTTTKIYLPYKEQFDYMAVGIEEFNRLKHNPNKGIYVYGSSINDENKLIGVNPAELEIDVPNFQYLLIEADGSKRKSIKGWNNTEPVVLNTTTNTIGVISIEAIGNKINEVNVFRVKEFLNITNAAENDTITEANIVSLIFHKYGLFKNSTGEKILFINKVENEEQWKTAEKLIDRILRENMKHLIIDKIIVGSLLEKKYKIFSNYIK
ncbi:selenium cofactor biosynthesis protein YqeC [Candidatus Clostridium radicumherbarum]|uniref:Selenium cofactor biosynthesis protein YqeC n=1 Tax=Candidatus Clostridium radicumherbarum TaxID=3381662 RepID=A0ABW8TN23_9CLOT